MAEHDDAPPTHVDLVEVARKINAIRPGVSTQAALAAVQSLWVIGWRPSGHRCLTVKVQVDGKVIDEAVRTAVRTYLASAEALPVVEPVAIEGMASE